ncbi:MAG TPA: vWA domain-containing protein [Clostridia bacterium]|nr:vWA domain-containing protein [Clostridia bacterium]
MKNRKGVTLVELILALALIGIIIAIGTNIFLIGNKSQKAAVLEAEMQANTRLVSEHINNIMRFATKTHTIPRSSFQYSEDGVRDPITSYIGITKEGHVVIDEPGEAGQPRKIQYLFKKQEGIDYEIIFDTVSDADGNEMDKVLSFSIVGKRDGKIVNEIVSKVDILNSINIDHLGTPSDPAVALAYSMVDPGSQEWIEMSPDAYITLVLDRSGSMAWDMDGKSTYINNNKRIEILKEKALKMMDRLANLDFNIYVSVVPFSNNANNPYDFINLQDTNGLTEVKNLINGLSADGATNTGDGIRRAYYRLRNKADNLKSTGQIDDYSDITQHMMILVDGETNTETRKITGTFLWFVTAEHMTFEDGNTNNSVAVGNRRTVSVGDNNNNYVNFIGDNLIKPYKYTHEGVEKQAINSFVIGFSNLTKDHNSLQAIGNSVLGKQFEHLDGTMKPYILATNADELDFAFEQFEAEVENSLWVITRPQMWP